MPSEPEITRARLLDAAEQLFYGRGIQAVGMDDVRSAAGLSLKRLYQLYPSKAALVQAYLDRRDVRWRGRLAEYVDAYEDPAARVLAVFDWLALWFGEPDFRGCAWINAFGELGTVSLAVARQARDHKLAFRDYLRALAADAGLERERADQLWLLAEGAMVSAGILASPGLAQTAKSAARQLLG